MGLPKLNTPITMIDVPSFNKEVAFRPYLVKEEKILLIGKETKEVSDIFIAIKQIINNCIMNEKIDIEKFYLFDIEYIFLKLRSISVSNICSITVTDIEDKKEYNIEIDLNEVKKPIFDKEKLLIKINDTFVIKMKYPTVDIYNDKEFLNITDDYIFELLIKCIDIIYDGDDIHEASNYTKEELSEFLDNLDTNTYKKMRIILSEMPKMRHVISYTNSFDKKIDIVLENLTDFFTF